MAQDEPVPIPAPPIVMAMKDDTTFICSACDRNENGTMVAPFSSGVLLLNILSPENLQQMVYNAFSACSSF